MDFLHKKSLASELLICIIYLRQRSVEFEITFNKSYRFPQVRKNVRTDATCLSFLEFDRSLTKICM